MRKKLLVLLLLLLCLVVIMGCTRAAPTTESSGYIRYYYDEAHDVCIWTINEGGFGEGIFVLPANQVKNPELPMELKP